MLVDTGAWHAIADRSDRHHARARKFYLAEAPRRRLVTTDLILAESWTLIRAHLGRDAALTFWHTLRTTRTDAHFLVDRFGVRREKAFTRWPH